jgi:hypothetical protein
MARHRGGDDESQRRSASRSRYQRLVGADSPRFPYPRLECAAVVVGGLVAGIPLTADPAHAAPAPQQPIRRLRGGMRAEEIELLKLLNDARANPEKYPPNGNRTGAIMVGCGPPFKSSPKVLTQIALAHNWYLASQPIEWVQKEGALNMHRGPNGQLVWASGEPMDQAGYHTYRSEIVAWGFATPGEVVRAWMQDDEAWQWGHRNLILNCTMREAGPGYTAGGPANHYWTVDMGTP